MQKCLTCRKTTEELDSRWDRIRQWFFHRFHEDIIDLSQDKYTQGFGDGYKKGFAEARERSDEVKKHLEDIIMELQSAPTASLPALDEQSILTLEKTSTGQITKVLVGKKEAPIQMLKDLKHEAGMLMNTKLWVLFQETIKDQAYRTMFEKSESFDDMKTGKAMLYSLGVQKNIVDLLVGLNIKDKTKS